MYGSDDEDDDGGGDDDKHNDDDNDDDNDDAGDDDYDSVVNAVNGGFDMIVDGKKKYHNNWLIPQPSSSRGPGFYRFHVPHGLQAFCNRPHSGQLGNKLILNGAGCFRQ